MSPMPTDPDPMPTIIFMTFSAWVVAALVHLYPRTVTALPVSAMVSSMTMFEYSSSCPTATATDAALNEMVDIDCLLVAAIASAEPSTALFLGFNTG